MFSRTNAPQKFETYKDSNVIRKAKEHAEWTVPSLMIDPTLRSNAAEVLQYDYQSAGALLVNNLTSKLGSTLFPTGRPSFKIDVDSDMEAAAAQAGISQDVIQQGAANLERAATDQLFKNSSLSKLYQAIKYLLVTGNALLYRDPERHKFLVWNLNSYVVKRNAFAEPTEVIIKQVVELQDLPIEWQQAYMSKYAGASPEDTVEMYTEIVWDWLLKIPTVYVSTTINDVAVGDVSTYPHHLCPYVVLAWNVQVGEHYGRSYIEEYAGDFAKQSLLSEQLGLYEIESLKLLNIVSNQSGGDADQLQDASTGQYLSGEAGMITAYEAGDYHKIQAISASLREIFLRLSRAFMYNGAQRDAERVTAEEVREVANEAEALFGGNYSVLAESMQAPLAYLTMYEVANMAGSNEALSALIIQAYRPVIMTGVKALTQNAETQNLLRAIQEASVALQLGQLSNLYDMDKVLDLIMRNNSVDAAALMKSPEQLEAEAEQQRQMQEAEIQSAENNITEILQE